MTAKIVSNRKYFFEDNAGKYAVRIIEWSGGKPHGVELYRLIEGENKLLVPLKVSTPGGWNGVSFPRPR